MMKAENSGKMNETQKNKENNKAIAVLTVFLLLCAGLYVFIYVIPGITGVLTRTAVISYGNLKGTDQSTGFLVR